MTSAVGFASQQVYAPPASANGTPADDPSKTEASKAAATPSASTATGGALLAPSTVSALVAEQGAPAAAVDPAAPADPPPFDSYEVYMPTREGFSAHALAVGVDSPNTVSSSAGLTDDEIATDARARLDANYGKMADSGKPFQENTWEGVDWYSAFGDLDPKSLTAVQDNRDGLFSGKEQTYAKMFLDTQASFRAGGYNGPTRLEGQFMASGASAMSRDVAAKTMQDWDAEAAKKSADVGTELGRASMRVLLGPEASAGLFTDPKDAMLSLLVDALQKALAKDPDVLKKIGNVRTADDLEKQDWFKDNVQQLNAIIHGSDDKTAAPPPSPAAADPPPATTPAVAS
jgi:hypothetical protein